MYVVYVAITRFAEIRVQIAYNLKIVLDMLCVYAVYSRKLRRGYTIMARYLYSELASALQARANCIASHNEEWEAKHEQHILSLVESYMPHGSGFDSGTKIDLSASHADKLVFDTAYHHMNDAGFYDGWTEHRVTVTPSLHRQFNLRISGRNRNDIKEYVNEEFYYKLAYNVERVPDPFAGIPDYTVCADCCGTASVTASDGARYCDGCAKHAEDRNKER